MKRTILTFSLIFLIHLLVTGQVTLVKDIHTLPAGSSLSYLIQVGSTMFFTCLRPEYGTELWKSDGTSDGTVMVKDIHPGSQGSSEPLNNFHLY